MDNFFLPYFTSYTIINFRKISLVEKTYLQSVKNIENYIHDLKIGKDFSFE